MNYYDDDFMDMTITISEPEKKSSIRALIEHKLQETGMYVTESGDWKHRAKSQSCVLASATPPAVKPYIINEKMNNHFPGLKGISNRSPQEIHGDFLRVLEYVKNKQMGSPSYVAGTQAILENDGFTENNVPRDEYGNYSANEALKQLLLKMQYMRESKKYLHL